MCWACKYYCPKTLCQLSGTILDLQRTFSAHVTCVLVEKDQSSSTAMKTRTKRLRRDAVSFLILDCFIGYRGFVSASMAVFAVMFTAALKTLGRPATKKPPKE